MPIKRKRISPIHPGEILQEEFLKPLSLSQYRLAKDIHVPPRRINEIVHGVRSISIDTALRLAMYFGTSSAFWINLQTQYEIANYPKDIFEHIRPYTNGGVDVRPHNTKSISREKNVA